MAERDKTEHISESIMERFCMRALTENELTTAARHLTRCPECQAEFVSTLRRQREVADLTFTLAPEFWLRHEHLDYEQLVELADDKLDAADLELIDAHLKVCAPCAEDVRSFLAFKEQIEPEMKISYAPIERESERERLSWVNWWSRLVWKPIYSAVIVIIGIVLVIGGALLLNRRAENQQVRQVPTPNVSPSSTPEEQLANLPSPPASPSESPSEKPNGAEALVVLNDRGRAITVDKSGNVAGLDDVPVPTRDEIAQALSSGRIEQPPILRDLRGQDGALRGSKATEPFKLTSPSRAVIVSDRPMFRWERASDANSYRVYVNDPAGREVARSEELPANSTRWILPRPLKRGDIYSWTVVAVVNGKEIVSPGSSSPEMKFHVLSAIRLQQLRQLKKTRSHLALGVFYGRVGMIAEAERELRELVRLNLNSRVARNLLSSIHLEK